MAFSTRFGVSIRPSRVGSSPSSASRFLIRSCIFLFYISVSAGRGLAADPDALYRDRANLSSAREAAAIWAVSPSDGRAFEFAWKLARACYWLGGHVPDEKERRAFLNQGIAAGQKAATLERQKPEGHFWTAANMGALAEASGLTAGLKYRGSI